MSKTLGNNRFFPLNILNIANKFGQRMFSAESKTILIYSKQINFE